MLCGVFLKIQHTKRSPEPSWLVDAYREKIVRWQTFFFAVYHVQGKVFFPDHVQKWEKNEATESSACSSFKHVLCKLCHVIKKCVLTSSLGRYSSTSTQLKFIGLRLTTLQENKLLSTTLKYIILLTLVSTTISGSPNLKAFELDLSWHFTFVITLRHFF